MRGKKILIGISGGIAAYKIPQLVRDFRKRGMDVRIVMTEAAKEFVSPLTLSTVSGHEVIIGNIPVLKGGIIRAGTWHIDLAQETDCMLIAPATANTIAKIAHGFSDNVVTTLALAMRGPVIMAPSMDTDMLQRDATQFNIRILRERGYTILEPATGELASGLYGQGRLPDLPIIQKEVEYVLNYSSQDFKGKKVLVTAGPTREAIDPVRFISNRSTGTMGFAIANAAAQRGADVTLITGPVSLFTPRNVKRVDVETAYQMYLAVKKYHKSSDIVIMAAAVSDFSPVTVSKQKIKKNSPGKDIFNLKLKKNIDIISEAGKNKRENILVGFALETEDEISNAKKKLHQKNLDLIVLNNPLIKGSGFGTGTNKITIITRDGNIHRLKKMPKYYAAHEILNHVKQLF